MLVLSRHLIVFILGLAILLQTFGKSIVCLDYALNKEYIARVLCINKNKPEKNCNGKCHLKKQLKEQDKKEQSPVNSAREKVEIKLFSDFKKLIEQPLFVTTIKHNSPFFSSKSSIHLPVIFHPPAC